MSPTLLLLLTSLLAGAASLQLRAARPPSPRAGAASLQLRAARPPSPRAGAIHLEAFDLNAAITAMNKAVNDEDYAEAARLKKLIEAEAPATAGAAAVWADTTVPSWLVARLEGLGIRYPTPVQSAALQCLEGDDVVVRAPTGSGKTLAFLVGLLGLSESELSQRGEATTAAVANTEGKLTPTMAMNILAPALSSAAVGASAGTSRGEEGGFKVPPRGPPLALVLVPTDALAEQVAAVAYTLVGGYARASRTWEPGAGDSLFKYQGPKGCRVLSIVSRADGQAGGQGGAQGGGQGGAARLAARLSDCDVLVTTPACFDAALRELGGKEMGGEEMGGGGAAAAAAAELLSSVRCVAVDEADMCLTPSLVDLLELAPADAVRVFVGATVSDALVTDSVAAGALRSPMLASGDGSARQWREASGGGAAEATGAPAGGGASQSLTHRAAVAPGGLRERLLLLARMMRAELRIWRREGAANTARPRCVVFTADEASAVTAATALRSALWGEHAVAVLLPSSGASPSLIASTFRRGTSNEEGFKGIASSGGGFGASVLVSPASAARGLDFKDVSSVYALDHLPTSAAEYAHMAGRAGRIGTVAAGEVSSVLGTEEEVGDLAELVRASLDAPLRVLSAEALADIGRPEGGKAEEEEEALEARRRLEDSLQLQYLLGGDLGADGGDQ